MVNYNNTAKTPAVAKRGGYAILFIYAPFILIAVFIGNQLKLPAHYLYMGIAVLAVFAGYYLMPVIFRKPIICADSDGIWTNSLNQVLWNEVKDIRIEKEREFSTSATYSAWRIRLIIETTDGKEDRFNANFMNVNAEDFCKQLNQFRNIHNGK